ncbi:MAG: PilZ domain-containing protein [Bdellovibrionales bacterium]
MAHKSKTWSQNSTNVIDMTVRRQAQLTSQSIVKQARAVNASVENINEMRQSVLTQERRRNRRTLLTNFIGAFVVVPSVGLQAVVLHDVSGEGMAFDTLIESGCFRVGEEYALRVYLSRDTYFPLTVKIKNHREIKAEGVYRHGTLFVKAGSDHEALKSFIHFVETISTVLKKDTGDHQISTIRG